MSTILLGSSGFLGPQILDKYPDIVSVGRTKPSTAIHHIDCPSIDDMPRVLDRLDFDKVIMMIGSSNHTVLNLNVPLHVEALEKNVLPLYKIMSYFRHRKVKKLVSFSSILLYDRERMVLPVHEHQPMNPYQNQYIFSKYLGEEVAKFFSDVPNNVIRLTNIYGPTTVLGRPDLVNQLVEGLLFEKSVKVITKKPKRDFIFTEDAADAIVGILNSRYTGPVNIASGVMSSVGEIVDILQDLSGIKIEETGGDHTGHLEFVANIDCLKHYANFEPKFDLRSGLEKTWFKMKEMYNV